MRRRVSRFFYGPSICPFVRAQACLKPGWVDTRRNLIAHGCPLGRGDDVKCTQGGGGDVKCSLGRGGDVKVLLTFGFG